MCENRGNDQNHARRRKLEIRKPLTEEERDDELWAKWKGEPQATSEKQGN
jgi:hypothetical protein